eukprot:6315770-Alexandrium_andersonii.AAC.2
MPTFAPSDARNVRVPSVSIALDGIWKFDARTIGIWACFGPAPLAEGNSSLRACELPSSPG